VFASQESSRRNWTVGILYGEFVKSQDPSDRVEEQGSYGLNPLHQYSRGCER
jgi:hypothetical protein